MGLSAFSRMRRERAAVEKIEAERFKKWNEAHNQARLASDPATREGDVELREAAAEEEKAAVERIGEKVRVGMESKIIDEPLRKDHAAEIAGRNMKDVDLPIDPVEHIDQRIPQHVTANEKLVPKTQVDQKGPTKAMVDAAAREVGSLPAAATAEERVAPKGEPEPTGTDEGGGPVDEKTAAEEANEDEEATVDIPEDWEDLPWQQKRSLAASLKAGFPINSMDDANRAISEELARRS